MFQQQTKLEVIQETHPKSIKILFFWLLRYKHGLKAILSAVCLNRNRGHHVFYRAFSEIKLLRRFANKLYDFSRMTSIKKSLHCIF